MSAPMLFLGSALVAPILGRWLLSSGRARRLPSLGTFVFCSLLWLMVAWRVGAPEESGAPWNLQSFFLLVFAGGAWVEFWLLLWRWPRKGRGGATETGEPTVSSAESIAAGGMIVPEEAEPGQFDPFAHLPEIEGGEDGEEESVPQLSLEAERLLERVLGSSQLPVETIMTPREKIDFIEAGTSVTEALSEMRTRGRARLVVVEGSLDRILGITHAKDLAPLILDGREKQPVRQHLRRWLRVPRGRPTSRVLEDFRRNRLQLAIVGDALGRTLGLVTLGDVFRYIAGPANGDGPATETGATDHGTGGSGPEAGGVPE